MTAPFWMICRAPRHEHSKTEPRQRYTSEGDAIAGFEGLPKKEKVKELDRLFSDWGYRETLGLSREVNAKIDAWLPEELRFAAPMEEGEK